MRIESRYQFSYRHARDVMRAADLIRLFAGFQNNALDPIFVSFELDCVGIQVYRSASIFYYLLKALPHHSRPEDRIMELVYQRFYAIAAEDGVGDGRNER